LIKRRTRSLLATLPILLALGLVFASARASGEPAATKPHVSTAEVALPTEWTACARDSDCVLIPIGCDGSHAAANRSRAGAAEKVIYARFGDPRTMDCAMPKPRKPTRPACRNRRCAAVEGK
jgi:hypothetical protein